MAEPTIVEVQEHIIEMQTVRYHLVNLSNSGLERGNHQPWCQHCDGNTPAPRDDEDRIKLFDHYCHGYQIPLLCDPHRAIVYKRIDETKSAFPLGPGIVGDGDQQT
jgi:hypothetical protein